MKQKRPPLSKMTQNEYDAAALSSDLSSLFGVPLIAADGSWNYTYPGFNYQTNRVFAIERYHELCEKFEAALASGAPLVARLENVEVHANTFHGVVPYTCNYTVIWNQAPRQWLEKVPPATLEAVLNGEPDSVNTPGNFPTFATIGQNKGLMEFTPLQTNLLADMMAWIVDAEWDKLRPCFS